MLTRVGISYCEIGYRRSVARNWIDRAQAEGRNAFLALLLLRMADSTSHIFTPSSGEVMCLTALLTREKSEKVVKPTEPGPGGPALGENYELIAICS